MRIVDILSEDLILPDVRATAKNDVLGEVVDLLVSNRPDIDRETALHELVQRERLGSTGVGHGFAIPHAKLPRLEGLIACFARSREGVEFESLDGQPAHLFLALLAPEGAAGMHLKALARASRMFRARAFREQLLAEDDRHSLWQIIRNQDEILSRDG
jgi:PTS system nitrogen regulatory IIA component